MKCKLEGCEKDKVALGYCGMHYARVKRHGDPGAVGKQPRRDKRNGYVECSVPECDLISFSRGVCQKHYKKLPRIHGGDRKCSLPECDEPHYGLSYCMKHYERFKANGDPRKVRLVQNQPLGTQYKTEHGYTMLKIGKGEPGANSSGWIKEHRHIMAQHIGRPLYKDENVHHINGVRDDNRIENLELWSTMHPCGQRVQDKVDFAREILRRYSNFPGVF